jgi:hypothetical protein
MPPISPMTFCCRRCSPRWLDASDYIGRRQLAIHDEAPLAAARVGDALARGSGRFGSKPPNLFDDN